MPYLLKQTLVEQLLFSPDYSTTQLAQIFGDLRLNVDKGTGSGKTAQLGDQRPCSPANYWLQCNRDSNYLPKEISAENKCSSDHSRICKPVVGVEIIVVCLGFLKVFCTWAGGLNLEESTSAFKKLNKNHHHKKFSFYAKSFCWYKQINMDMLLQRFAFLILKNSAYGILLLLLLNFHRRKPL